MPYAFATHACISGPPLPSRTASGKHLPVRCFNPFEDKAPTGTWNRLAQEVADCVSAMLRLPPTSLRPLLMIHVTSLSTDINLDEQMSLTDAPGYCVHNDRDVLLCGLRADYSASTFDAVAHDRLMPDVASTATEMIGIIAAAAKATSKSFAITDDYTTRFASSLSLWLTSFVSLLRLCLLLSCWTQVWILLRAVGSSWDYHLSYIAGKSYR